MHDVITKTMPANMALVGLQRDAAAEIEAKTAARQDSAMIERDLSRGARPPAPAAEDPLDSVRDAIDELVEFASEDAVNAGSFNPSLQGPNEPDVRGIERRIEDVLYEVCKLIATVARGHDTQVCDSEQVGNFGLLVEHTPGARVSL